MLSKLLFASLVSLPVSSNLNCRQALPDLATLTWLQRRKHPKSGFPSFPEPDICLRFSASNSDEVVVTKQSMFGNSSRLASPIRAQINNQKIVKRVKKAHGQFTKCRKCKTYDDTGREGGVGCCQAVPDQTIPVYVYLYVYLCGYVYLYLYLQNI